MADSSFDDAGFERLLRATHDTIRAHIAGMGVPSDHVDDVAQEVYLDYARHPERRPVDVEPLRWLRGMARNCSHEYFRRHSRQAAHLSAIAGLLAPPAADEAPDAETQETLLQALQRCLGRLPAAQRALIESHYRDGRPVAELAAEQGRTPGALHMALARLREALRHCMLGQLGAGSP
jgi:RNA polymerase sigma-70 factor (ECF subfamily)